MGNELPAMVSVKKTGRGLVSLLGLDREAWSQAGNAGKGFLMDVTPKQR